MVRRWVNLFSGLGEEKIDKMKLKGLIFAVGIAAFAISCGQTPQNSSPAKSNANTDKSVVPTSAATPVAELAAVKSGKDLYTVNCMTCHKDSGKGGKVTVDGKELNPDDLTSAKMKGKSDEKLYGYIADGIEDEGMPAFKDKMSKAEIDAVVKHLREIQK